MSPPYAYDTCSNMLVVWFDGSFYLVYGFFRVLRCLPSLAVPGLSRFLGVAL